MKAPNEKITRREFLKEATLAAAMVAVSACMNTTAVPLLTRAGEAGTPRGPRASYFFNGEIHVTELGKPEGKPLTKGHMDFKPSWSKTGDKLVFFRRLKDDPVTAKWITAICIIGVDGTGFHQLTDGTHTDFNPTWTRDGLNTPVWNRKNPVNGSYSWFVMQGRVGGKPGEEVAITDKSYHTWAFSSLMDGRLLVSCKHPTQGWGYYLMTRKPGGTPLYERIDCELVKKGLLERVSVSPSEKKVCFEFMTGFKLKDPGHAIYIADFDVQKRAITNLKAIANPEEKPFWYAYPRWLDGEAAVVYQSSETGKNQLYVYRLEDGSTKRVSANATADYRYPHGEAAPC
jgi:Tol biopolymer transport system component